MTFLVAFALVHESHQLITMSPNGFPVLFSHFINAFLFYFLPCSLILLPSLCSLRRISPARRAPPRREPCKYSCCLCTGSILHVPSFLHSLPVRSRSKITWILRWYSDFTKNKHLVCKKKTWLSRDKIMAILKILPTKSFIPNKKYKCWFMWKRESSLSTCFKSLKVFLPNYHGKTRCSNKNEMNLWIPYDSNSRGLERNVMEVVVWEVLVLDLESSCPEVELSGATCPHTKTRGLTNDPFAQQNSQIIQNPLIRPNNTLDYNVVI